MTLTAPPPETSSTTAPNGRVANPSADLTPVAAPTVADDRRRRALLAVTVLAVLLLYAWSFRHTFVDDAYIQFQYARTLAEHGTWGFYAGHPANTATSPLNVLLEAAGVLLLGSATRAAIVLTALELAAMLWLLLHLSRRFFANAFFGLVAFVALATNLLLLSTLGLESLLYALLLLAAVALWLEERWRWMAVALGLLTLARPDGILLLVILLAATPRPLLARARLLGLCAAVIAPWFLVSWVALGSFVPDTLIIKIEQTAWGPWTFFDGAELYRRRFPFETIATVALLPFALLAPWRARRGSRRFLGALVAYAGLHYAAYSLLGVPPYHWYYVNQIVPLLIVAAFGAAVAVEPLLRHPGARRLGWATAALPALGLLILIADERLPLREAPINTNWATATTYREIGVWLTANTDANASIAVAGEIGTLAYSTDRLLVNDFSDKSIADRLIDEADYDDLPVIGWLIDLNFLWRDDAEPLPLPTLVLDAHRLDAPPACPPDDAGCLMVWRGETEWIDGMGFTLRPLPAPTTGEEQATDSQSS